MDPMPEQSIYNCKLNYLRGLLQRVQNFAVKGFGLLIIKDGEKKIN